MEEFLRKLLERLKCLNVRTGLLQAEFGNHMGYSFAVPLLVFYLFGNESFNQALGVWAAYSVTKELFIDGHLKRMRNGTESIDERRDFWTDLFSRLLPIAILSTIQVIRKAA